LKKASKRVMRWTSRVYKTALRSFSTAEDSRRSNEKVNVIKFSAFSRIYVIQLKDFLITSHILYWMKYFNMIYKDASTA